MTAPAGAVLRAGGPVQARALLRAGVPLPAGGPAWAGVPLRAGGPAYGEAAGAPVPLPAVGARTRPHVGPESERDIAAACIRVRYGIGRGTRQMPCPVYGFARTAPRPLRPCDTSRTHPRCDDRRHQPTDPTEGHVR